MNLHPKYGVNPTMGVCMWCGKDDGTIGMLGLNGGREAPRRSVLTQEPCDECKAGMAQGITLIEVSTEPGERRIKMREGVYFCGRWLVVKEEAMHRIFGNAPEAVESALRERRAFTDKAVIDFLLQSQTKGE